MFNEINDPTYMTFYLEKMVFVSIKPKIYTLSREIYPFLQQNFSWLIGNKISRKQTYK
jgi:hypothetical protein